jgi:hypothetical protein
LPTFYFIIPSQKHDEVRYINICLLKMKKLRHAEGKSLTEGSQLKRAGARTFYTWFLAVLTVPCQAFSQGGIVGKH